MSKLASTGGVAQVREATFADYPQMAALESRYRLHPRPYDEWVHLWQGNPACRDLPEWKIGWVVENEQKEIVGHISNVPSAFEFRGRELIAASGRGLAVDERYRSYAFPLFSSFFNQKNIDLILNSTVNAQGMNLHELFHCQRCPAGAWDQSVFWITGYRGFAAKLAESKNAPLPTLLSYPVSAVLAVQDVFKRQPRPPKIQGAELDFTAGFDQRFEVFWKELKARQPSSLLAVRSHDTLDWHFKFALEQQRVWIVTLTCDSSLRAYGIFLRQDNYNVGLKRVRLVDFQSLDNEPHALGGMLWLALERCREQGFHMLEVNGFSAEKRAMLEPLAPHHRQLPCWLYYYKARDKQLAESLKDPSVWDPTPFDGDGAL